jgi:hypothetical protein
MSEIVILSIRSVNLIKAFDLLDLLDVLGSIYAISFVVSSRLGDIPFLFPGFQGFGGNAEL